MIARVATLLLLLTTAFSGSAQNLDGVWTGTLKLGNNHSLKLVMHIDMMGNTITLDSPDQGAKGISTVTDVLTRDSVAYRVPSLRLEYSGRCAGNKITGTFSQSGLRLPLTFEKGEVKVNRPQTPIPPFPYTIEEVKITNTRGESTLAGTLCIPANASATTPFVVLVTGSGLQNRDEELFEHKPFAVIADYLARCGIGSLRYDDRGFGASVGNAFDATTADFASDAQAVVEWLRQSRKEANVGILGHSEGGQIAYILAAQNIPDFIVSVAGPSIKGTRTIAYQNKMALINSGIDSIHASNFGDAIERLFEYKLEHPSPASAIEQMLILPQIYPQHAQDAITRHLSGSLLANMGVEPDYSWMMYFLNYNPAEDMGKIKVPTLIIYGEKDQQVPPTLNAVPAAVAAPKAEIKVYPGLNHLMQHASTGRVEEYSQIEETISPEVLSDIATFILSVGR